MGRKNKNFKRKSKILLGVSVATAFASMLLIADGISNPEVASSSSGLKARDTRFVTPQTEMTESYKQDGDVGHREMAYGWKGSLKSIDQEDLNGNHLSGNAKDNGYKEYVGTAWANFIRLAPGYKHTPIDIYGSHGDNRFTYLGSLADAQGKNQYQIQRKGFTVWSPVTTRRLYVNKNVPGANNSNKNRPIAYPLTATLSGYAEHPNDKTYYYQETTSDTMRNTLYKEVPESIRRLELIAYYGFGHNQHRDTHLEYQKGVFAATYKSIQQEMPLSITHSQLTRPNGSRVFEASKKLRAQSNCNYHNGPWHSCMKDLSDAQLRYRESYFEATGQKTPSSKSEQLRHRPLVWFSHNPVNEAKWRRGQRDAIAKIATSVEKHGELKPVKVGDHSNIALEQHFTFRNNSGSDFRMYKIEGDESLELVSLTQNQVVLKYNRSKFISAREKGLPFNPTINFVLESSSNRESARTTLFWVKPNDPDSAPLITPGNGTLTVPAPAPTPRVANLEVTKLDSKGRVRAGVQFYVRDSGGREYYGRTNSNGKVAFNYIIPGSTQIRELDVNSANNPKKDLIIPRSGYYRKTVTVPAATNVNSKTITRRETFTDQLNPLVEIKKVDDISGKPVQDVHFRMSYDYRDPNGNYRKITQTAKSDANGIVRFPDRVLLDDVVYLSPGKEFNERVGKTVRLEEYRAPDYIDLKPADSVTNVYVESINSQNQSETRQVVIKNSYKPLVSKFGINKVAIDTPRVGNDMFVEIYYGQKHMYNINDVVKIYPQLRDFKYKFVAYDGGTKIAETSSKRLIDFPEKEVMEKININKAAPTVNGAKKNFTVKLEVIKPAPSGGLTQSQINDLSNIFAIDRPSIDIEGYNRKNTMFKQSSFRTEGTDQVLRIENSVVRTEREWIFNKAKPEPQKFFYERMVITKTPLPKSMTTGYGIENSIHIDYHNDRGKGHGIKKDAAKVRFDIIPELVDNYQDYGLDIKSRNGSITMDVPQASDTDASGNQKFKFQFPQVYLNKHGEVSTDKNLRDAVDGGNKLYLPVWLIDDSIFGDLPLSTFVNSNATGLGVNNFGFEYQDRLNIDKWMFEHIDPGYSSGRILLKPIKRENFDENHSNKVTTVKVLDNE